MIEIRNDDFSVDEIIKKLKRPEVGAIVTFVGTVRGDSDIEKVQIESYEEMALEKLREIATIAKNKFRINDVAIIHRVGNLNVMDNIVIIAVCSSHRKEAFESCGWIIDELKKIVPIWKKEIRSGG